MDRQDSEIERDRYSRTARNELHSAQPLPVGHEDLHQRFHAPYELYERALGDVVQPTSTVLELGAGSGRYTVRLTELSRRVLALDISTEALQVALRRTAGAAKPLAANIEALPLRDRSVDVVACAGALSYGDPQLVDAAIRRVLRPGGAVILVDSLNHNPAYRLNRWVRYRRGQRTRSTLLRMPTMGRIEALTQSFDTCHIETFGSFLFLYPVLSRVGSAERAQRTCEQLDDRLGKGRFGFKVVLIAEGYRGSVQP